MKCLFLALAMIIMAVMPSVAGPSYPSTTWVEECSKPEKVIGDNVNTCRAYIHGLINALAIWQYVSPETALVCFPPNADHGKIREQILPQVRQLARQDISASVLLTRVLQERLPCQRKSRTPTSRGFARGGGTPAHGC